MASVVLKVSAQTSDDERVIFHFAVEDTGDGIPLDVQRHIFDFSSREPRAEIPHGPAAPASA